MMGQYKIESFKDFAYFVEAMRDVVDQLPLPEGFAFALALPVSVIADIPAGINQAYGTDYTLLNIINYNDLFDVYLIPLDGEMS